jgi:hypothetical protein
MGESLIRLGRPDEALPALDEAVAALPKDPWLARTREEALAVKAGAPPNLLLNPSFDREGTWGLRVPSQWNNTTLATMLNEVVTISDGRARLTATEQEPRMLTQEVFGVDANRRYRLTLRLRAEGLDEGGVVAYLYTSGGRNDVFQMLMPSDLADWTTVVVEVVPGPPRADTTENSLTVAVGFSSDAPPGAVVWCDEASLTLLDSSR